MRQPAPDEPQASEGAQAQPARRRIYTEKEIHLADPQRQGCLRWGAVLGIVVGVLVAFLVVPPCMRWAFQPERVAVGEVFNHEGLRAQVVGLSYDGAAREWVVLLDVTVTKTWHAGVEDVRLEFDDGSEVQPVPGTVAPPRQVTFGEPGRVELRFAAERSDVEPKQLIVDDPQIEFALPPPGVL